MAELNLKQITDRLNAEFTGDTRKLVFWYDDKGEFTEDIDLDPETFMVAPNSSSVLISLLISSIRIISKVNMIGHLVLVLKILTPSKGI